MYCAVFYDLENIFIFFIIMWSIKLKLNKWTVSIFFIVFFINIYFIHSLLEPIFCFLLNTFDSTFSVNCLIEWYILKGKPSSMIVMLENQHIFSGSAWSPINCGLFRIQTISFWLDAESLTPKSLWQLRTTLLVWRTWWKYLS